MSLLAVNILQALALFLTFSMLPLLQKLYLGVAHMMLFSLKTILNLMQ